MPLAEVIPIRDGAKLNDIPSMMRQLADQIESGEVKAEAMLCIVPQPDDFPTIYGWGEHMGDYANVGVLEMAKTWLINNTTERGL